MISRIIRSLRSLSSNKNSWKINNGRWPKYGHVDGLIGVFPLKFIERPYR